MIKDMIKHLTPRSEEEILGDNIENISDQKLLDIWFMNKLADFTELDKKVFYELKRRKKPQFEAIRKSHWFELHQHKL